MGRRLLAAAGILCLFALASWGPAIASEAGLGVDWGRPALAPPPLRPRAPAGPVDAVQGFFWTLAEAVAQARQEPEPEAFARAYAYLSPAWRARLPFPRFVAAWRGLGHLELLAALPAGSPAPGARARRVFVETRSVVPEPDGAAVVYQYGFFTTEPGPEGWRLSEGTLRREAFAAAADPAEAARRAAAAEARILGLPGSPGPATLRPTQDPRLAEAHVAVGQTSFRIVLYRLVDGGWVPLSATR